MRWWSWERLWYGIFFISVGTIITVRGGTSKNDQARFAAIAPLLGLYERPITTLQLGSQTGNISFAVARHFPSTVVVVGENKASVASLRAACKARRDCSDNIVILSKSITLEDLRILGLCEHFDVVFIDNVIATFGKQWLQAVQCMIELGDNIIFEVPYEQQSHMLDRLPSRALYQWLIKKGAQQIAHIQGDEGSAASLLLLSTGKRELKIPSWRHYENQKKHEGCFLIESTFTQKILYKKREEKRYAWHHGINLYTFKILHGVWPDNEHMRRELEQFKDLEHSDFRIWNLIVQGKSLLLIDFDDHRFSYAQSKHERLYTATVAIFQDDERWHDDPDAIIHHIECLYQKYYYYLYKISHFFGFA